MSYRRLPVISRGILLAALFATVCALPGLAFNKTFNETVPLQPGGTFELQNGAAARLGAGAAARGAGAGRVATGALAGLVEKLRLARLGP